MIQDLLGQASSTVKWIALLIYFHASPFPPSPNHCNDCVLETTQIPTLSLFFSVLPPHPACPSVSPSKIYSGSVLIILLYHILPSSLANIYMRCIYTILNTPQRMCTRAGDGL